MPFTTHEINKVIAYDKFKRVTIDKQNKIAKDDEMGNKQVETDREKKFGHLIIRSQYNVVRSFKSYQA